MTIDQMKAGLEYLAARLSEQPTNTPDEKKEFIRLHEERFELAQKYVPLLFAQAEEIFKSYENKLPKN